MNYLLITLFLLLSTIYPPKNDILLLAEIKIVLVNGEVAVYSRYDTLVYNNTCEVVLHLISETNDNCNFVLKKEDSKTKKL